MIKTKRTLVLQYWLPLLLWIVAIHSFSTDAFAGDRTSRFLEPFLLFLFPGLSPTEVDFWHGVLRKCGHIAEYFVLAVLAYRSFRSTEMAPSRARLIAAVLVLVTAVSDEVHQLLTISRTGSIVDIGYDAVGGLCALWCIKFYETRNLRSYSIL